MSLKSRLIWAFILVALVALIPAALIFNVGFGVAMRGPMRGLRLVDQFRNFAPLAMGRAWSVFAGTAALILAAGIGILTAGRITRSLRRLRDAAAALDLRDLSRRVPVEGKDEIADLARSFNLMCDRLEAEERSRRQLLADTAHELRHPLAVMQGRLDLMQDGKAPVDLESLLPLQDEVIRLTRLVGDLQDLSLAEVGGLSLHPASIDLGKLLETLFNDFEPVAFAKGVALTAEMEPGLPQLEADPDRLRQMLVNLLANALRYTGRDGKISVKIRGEAGQVSIRVADSGAGISPEDLPYVFDRFYRADKSRHRGTGGSGLGLAIVRSLAELHRGKVEVTSKLGEGSCFTLTLPVKTG